MPDPARIYLDNAATSFPKPEAAYAAMDNYNRYAGVPVGRGAYQQAVEVQAIVNRCRNRAAELFAAESPDRIIFTFNGTDSLNLAIHGVVNEGDHVITSTVEHNSVLRPLADLRARKHIEVTYLAPDDTGIIDAAAVRNALQPNTRLVCFIHASNVTGTLQPIADVAEVTREANVLFLVDAAQSAGHIPISLTELPIDILACPGHKGLLGPLGTGLLYLRPGIEHRLHSLRQGGTGTNSEDDHQPESMPDKFEAGNHNAPGLVGLEVALAYLQETTVNAVQQHETELTERLLDGLRGVSGITAYGLPTAAGRVGVISLNVDGFEPQILATVLDDQFQIQTRAGLHCAPGAHRHLQTFDTGGTVRFSVGPFTTSDDIDQAINALREIAAAS